jgi:hypothetical protein
MPSPGGGATTTSQQLLRPNSTPKVTTYCRGHLGDPGVDRGGHASCHLHGPDTWASRPRRWFPYHEDFHRNRIHHLSGKPGRLDRNSLPSTPCHWGDGGGDRTGSFTAWPPLGKNPGFIILLRTGTLPQSNLADNNHRLCIYPRRRSSTGNCCGGLLARSPCWGSA